MAVDECQATLDYADEDYALRKWHADPDRAGADRELAVFGREGFKGQREALPSWRERTVPA